MPKANFTAKPSASQLHEWYAIQKLSLRVLEKKTGASMPTLRKWLKEAGVAVRTVSEAKTGQAPAPQTVVASVASRRKHVVDGKDVVGYKLDSYGYVQI